MKEDTLIWGDLPALWTLRYPWIQDNSIFPSHDHDHGRQETVSLGGLFSKKEWSADFRVFSQIRGEVILALKY